MALLAACDSCPPCPQTLLASSTFTTLTQGGVLSGSDPLAFPWGNEPKEITVDTTARTVRLSYVRDGRAIVVSYRMTSLSQCP